MAADSDRLRSLPPPDFSPVVLEGAHVRLEPLDLRHHEALWEVAREPSIWAWYPVALATADELKAWIETALAEQARREALPFAIRDRASGRLIGSTRFGAISLPHRRAEIGWTWLAPDWQRTPANTEAKFLLLRHAFEALGLVRVEFKTDSLNEKSRKALLRIGAVQEGIHRNHMITHTGRLRHSVYFSVIEQDWAAVVKPRLEGLLQKPYNATNRE